VLDDHARGDLELGEQQPPGVKVEQVVERDLLAAELGDHREHVRAGPDLLVVRGPLVRVLAVGQLEHLLERAHEQRREVLALLLEPAGDRGVVPRGVGERLGRQPLARARRQVPAGLAQLVEHRVVALRADDRRRERVILGGRADHRRAADVDVLDHLGVEHATARGGPLERIEVDHDEIDVFDVVLLGLARVLGVVADREQPGIELRVQRLDAAVHDLRKPGQIVDRTDRDAGVGECRGGPARGDDLDPQVGQAAGEVDDARLVRDRQQCAGDLRATPGKSRPVRAGGRHVGLAAHRPCRIAARLHRVGHSTG
jgi:hypothetical protein